MTPSIRPVLEAVALVAAVRLRWPGYDADKTRIVQVPSDLPELVVPIFERERVKFIEWAKVNPQIAFHEEHIHIYPFWTGSQRIGLGYGRESDTLAVKLSDGIRERLAG